MGIGILPLTSTFTATPVKAALQAAREQQAIPQDVYFFLYGQMTEFMLRPTQFAHGATGALVLLRIEDWLRDDFKSEAPNPALEAKARPRLVSRSEDFVSQLSVLAYGVPQVWAMVCPSNGWIATRHKLQALCRTYGNVVTSRIRKLPITVLNCPPFLLKGDDHSNDRLGQMPYTQAAFDQLGEYLATEIKPTLRQTNLAALRTSASAQFASYLAGLNVQVKLSRPEAPDCAPVARMLRTIAAFSPTGEKPFLQDEEIEPMLAYNNCLLVSVSDRLADYRPTGLVLFQAAGTDLVIESMAFSCVVLGKQVEHAVISAIGDYAFRRGFLRLVFRFTAAGRNQPMKAFWKTISVRQPDGSYSADLASLQNCLVTVAPSPGAWAGSLNADLQPGLAPQSL